MSVLTVYEIHTYREGAWKIDSVFDDRDLAVIEAERIDRAARYSAVRVVEETFNEETQKGGTRTIFRATKADRANAETQARKSAGPQLTPAPPRKTEKRKANIVGQMIVASFVFSAIAGGGLVLIYLLNSLSAAQ